MPSNNSGSGIVVVCAPALVAFLWFAGEAITVAEARISHKNPNFNIIFKE